MKERRLPPGPGGRNGMSAAEVERHQRERLFAATLASVVENRYSGTSIEGICRLSGVARTSFYKFFDSKESCFLAAVDEIQELGLARVRAGYRRGEDWEDQIRSAFAELIEVLVTQPAAGRVYIVDVYEAGAPGRERARRGMAAFEDLLARSFDQSPGHAGLPQELVAAIVAGVQMVIHDRLRDGSAAELPGLASVLGDWALSYGAPPETLTEGVIVTAAPRVKEAQTGPRARIVQAVSRTCAEEGVGRLNVNRLAREARVSLRTLYEEFPGGAEETFLATFDEIHEYSLRRAREAYETERDWPHRMHAVNQELFAYLASEPASAKTVLVEVLAAGPKALDHRDASLAPFGELLREGQRLAPEVPGVFRETIVFAVYSLVVREIEAGGIRDLTRLVPMATYLELAPYVGAERAVEIANEPLVAAGDAAPGHRASTDIA
jgi:AcrR family transcriptional regulator